MNNQSRILLDNLIHKSKTDGRTQLIHVRSSDRTRLLLHKLKMKLKPYPYSDADIVGLCLELGSLIILDELEDFDKFVFSKQSDARSIL